LCGKADLALATIQELVEDSHAIPDTQLVVEVPAEDSLVSSLVAKVVVEVVKRIAATKKDRKASRN
jgi:hypothetical protein